MKKKYKKTRSCRHIWELTDKWEEGKVGYVLLFLKTGEDITTYGEYQCAKCGETKQEVLEYDEWGSVY